MPQTWNDTLEGHREAVRQAAMQAALEIASEAGFQKVSMSSVATRTGITRATLYKYFPDVESIFVEWHRRTLEHHVSHVERIAGGDGSATARLRAVLEFFAVTATTAAASPKSCTTASMWPPPRTRSSESLNAQGIEALEFRQDLRPRTFHVFTHDHVDRERRDPEAERQSQLALGIGVHERFRHAEPGIGDGHRNDGDPSRKDDAREARDQSGVGRQRRVDEQDENDDQSGRRERMAVVQRSLRRVLEHEEDGDGVEENEEGLPPARLRPSDRHQQRSQLGGPFGAPRNA